MPGRRRRPVVRGHKYEVSQREYMLVRRCGKVRETHSQILEGTSLLDVGEGSLELFELYIDLSLGLLGFGDLHNHIYPNHSPCSQANHRAETHGK